MENPGEHFQRVEVEPSFAGHNKRNVIYADQQQWGRPKLVPGRSSGNGKEPIFFEEYTFTKEPAQYPGQKEAWSRSRKTLMAGKQSDLAEQARKSKTPMKQLKAIEMSGNKRLQVEKLLHSRMRQDHPDFEYVLASLNLDKRGQKDETSAMHVIIRRQLKPKVRLDPFTTYDPPRPSVVSEVVHLEAVHEPQRQAQGGFKGPHQGPPPQAAFFTGQNQQPQIHQIPLQQYTQSFPPKQQGPPHGGQQNHPEPKGAHLFAGLGFDEHASGDRDNKGKDNNKKAQKANKTPRGSHGSQKARPQFSETSSLLDDEVIEICSEEEEGLFDRKHKSKKSKDSKKKDSETDARKHQKKQHAYTEPESSESSENDFGSFGIDHKKKKSKDHQKKYHKTDSHKLNKKRRGSSESSSQSENSDDWSRVSADSFPTTISSGGRSSKKDKEYFVDTLSHKLGSHGREPQSKGYRQHERDARRYKPRDLSPVSSGRTVRAGLVDEDVIITPGNSSRRHRDSQSSYGRQGPTHRRGLSYDDNVSIDYDQRSSASARHGPAYPKKISNRAFHSDRYHGESESEDEELKVRRLVNKALEKHEKEARLDERVLNEVRRQEEEKKIQERVWHDRASARMSKPYYNDEDDIRREYIPTSRSQPRSYYNDRYERPEAPRVQRRMVNPDIDRYH